MKLLVAIFLFGLAISVVSQAPEENDASDSVPAFEDGSASRAERQGSVDEMTHVSEKLKEKLKEEEAAERAADAAALRRVEVAKAEMDLAEKANQIAKAAFEKARDAHADAVSKLTKLKASLKVHREKFVNIMKYISAERSAVAAQEIAVSKISKLVSVVTSTTLEQAKNWNAAVELQESEEDPIMAWIGKREGESAAVSKLAGDMTASIAVRRANADKMEEEERAIVDRLEKQVAEWTEKVKQLAEELQAATEEYARTQRAYDVAKGKYEAESEAYKLSHAAFLKKMELMQREYEVLDKIVAKFAAYSSNQ
jgi:vacuolar-type H+-ATPase subunit I/STV1